MKLSVVISFLLTSSVLSFPTAEERAKMNDGIVNYFCEMAREKNTDLVTKVIKCGEDSKCLENVKNEDSKYKDIIEKIYKNCDTYFNLKECKDSIYAKCSDNPKLYCGSVNCENSKENGICKDTYKKYWAASAYESCGGSGYHKDGNYDYNRDIAPNGGISP